MAARVLADLTAASVMVSVIAEALTTVGGIDARALYLASTPLGASFYQLGVREGGR